MHPIITAAIAEERHAELLRRSSRNRKVRAVKRSKPARTARVPAAALVLRGWLVRS